MPKYCDSEFSLTKKAFVVDAGKDELKLTESLSKARQICKIMQLKLNPKICKNIELKSENVQKYEAKFIYFIRKYDPV
jgi:hypothetical protein